MLSPSSVSIAANRLGFAVQLCYMRYPGVALGAGESPNPALLQLVSTQVKVPAQVWGDYSHRDQTRREHQIELQSVYGFQPFLLQHYRRALQDLDGLAEQTDKGFLLATALVDSLRSQAILLPSINVIERLCAESTTRGNRRIFRVLTESLSQVHRDALDEWLTPRPEGNLTVMAWLRQSPAAPNAKHLLEHIDWLKVLEALDLPEGIGRSVHHLTGLPVRR